MLDKMPAYLVAAIGMGMPCIAMFVLATGTHSLAAVSLAVILMGLSFGAEGDILAYLTARYFAIEIYSTALSLFLMSVGIAIGLGSIILSFTLKISDGFVLYTSFAGFSVLLGGVNLFRLRAYKR